MGKIVDNLGSVQNAFGYTVLTPDEQQNMTDTFNDIFKSK